MTAQPKTPKTPRQWRRQPVTVRELVEALKRFDLDLPVVVDGYEDGYDSLTAESIDVIAIVPDVAKADRGWLGDHQRPEAISDHASVDTGWGGEPANSYTFDALAAATVLALALSRGDKAPRH